MVSVCPAVARVRVPGGVSRRVGESVSAQCDDGNLDRKRNHVPGGTARGDDVRTTLRFPDVLVVASLRPQLLALKKIKIDKRASSLHPRPLLWRSRSRGGDLDCFGGMAWNPGHGEGESGGSGASRGYASVTNGATRAGGAIGGASNVPSSAYFLPASHCRKRDPLGHVIARQARRVVAGEEPSDTNVGEAVRYIRSLRFLQKERGGDAGSSDASRSVHSEFASASTVKNVPPASHTTRRGGLEAFRFPASRIVLWDCTPLLSSNGDGDGVVHITALVHAPVVCINATTSKRLALRVDATASAKDGQESANANGAFVCARPTLDRAGEPCVSACLELLDGVDGDDAAAASRPSELKTTTGTSRFTETHSSRTSLKIVSSAPVDGETLETARARLETAVKFPDGGADELTATDTASETQMSSLTALNPGSVWAVQVAVSQKNAKLVVAVYARVSSLMFAATSILAPRIADSATHWEVMDECCGAKPETRFQTGLTKCPYDDERVPKKVPVRSGFLTLDQTRRLVPVKENDAAATQIPIVGVWVSGVTNVTHLAVWTACCRFVKTTSLTDKATQRGSFLCLVYPPLDRSTPSKTHPICFDVSETETGTKKTFVEFAGSCVCVAGDDTQVTMRAVALVRVERKAFGEASHAGEEKKEGPVLLKRPSPEGKEKETPRTPVPFEPATVVNGKKASPTWAPLYGGAPRTSYEVAAARSAARAVAANAKLMSPSRSPSHAGSPSLLSPSHRSPLKNDSFASSLPPGAARSVVEEQQRVIQELRLAVQTLQSEMLEMSVSDSGEWSDGGRVGDSNSQRDSRFSRDLMGGLPWETASSPSRGSTKSPLSKALAFGRNGGGRNAGLRLQRPSFATAGTSTSDFVGDWFEQPVETEVPVGEVPSISREAVTRNETARAVETKALARQASAAAVVADTKKKAGLPDTCIAGIPPDVSEPPPMMVSVSHLPHSAD